MKDYKLLNNKMNLFEDGVNNFLMNSEVKPPYFLCIKNKVKLFRTVFLEEKIDFENQEINQFISSLASDGHESVLKELVGLSSPELTLVESSGCTLDETRKECSFMNFY